MRCFGEQRVASIALGLTAMLGMSLAGSARAGDLFHPTLPKTVPAYDFNTGGEYYAPAVPYGHYAKDPHGAIAAGVGHVSGAAHGLGSQLKNKLAGLGGLGHGHGGHGHDGLGHGGLGHGHGLGGLGHGHGGMGHGHSGLGHGHGLGSLGHGHGVGGQDLAYGDGFSQGRGGLGHGHGLGGLGHGHKRAKNFGPYHPTTTVVATSQAAPSAQAGVAVGHGGCGLNGGAGCGQSPCGHGGLGHLSGLVGKLKCKMCGGGGSGCGGCGGLGFGDPCSSCHGGGCGACGGCGLAGLKDKLHGLGGHGLGGHGMGGHGLGGLKGKLHGLLGSAGGLAGPKYKWFVGPGGPVPLTPGYTPYIVTTRSPRDFFAFPPRNPDGF